MAPDRPLSPGGQPPDRPFLDRLARRVHLVRGRQTARAAWRGPEPPQSASPPDADEPLPPPRAWPRLPVPRWHLLAAAAFVALVAVAAVGLWQFSRPKPALVLQGHTGTVRGLAFSPDCSLLASGGDDCMLRVWEVSSGRARLTVRHNYPVECVAFCPGADFVATSAGGFVTFLDSPTGEEVGSFAPGPGRIAFSPDGKTLACASPSTPNAVALYDVASRKVRSELSGHNRFVCGTAFSPDGKTLASGSWDGTVRLWDLPTGRCRATITAMAPVELLAFSPDGQLLAGPNPWTTLQLWDARSGQELRQLGDFPTGINSVQFSQDGELLVVETGDSVHPGRVMVWDVATGRRLATVPGSVPGLSPAVFSRDGQKLATVGWDNAIRIWNVADLIGGQR